ncbi:MAG: helix-turn-helix transcriptional regulator [Deltaproteobacteria bacterium]|nr:helix-turn-helix transcriptional regulator [Deltaproteobacteria bacterium]
MKEFGAIVRFHRKQAGLSRIELANIAGLGKTVIYDIENGKDTIRFNTMLKVLNSLNITVSIDSQLMDQYKVVDNEEG